MLVKTGVSLEGVSETLLELVRQLEDEIGEPLTVTSGYRGGDSGPHGRGDALDIRAWNGELRYKIVAGAIAASVLRIGVYDRHVHLGLTDEANPSLWTGRSS